MRVLIRVGLRTGAATACAALMWVAAVAAQDPSATDRIAARISQQDFKQLFAAKAVAIVDTRDEDSYRSSRIPGALRLPFELLASDSPEGRQIVDRLKASKTPVVVYCACSGETSSLLVATLLQRLGVEDARALSGGWVDWFNDGNPITRD